MANYLSLEEAANKLGIPTDRLVELRSQGQVRGFRDGASWKFPENEIERLAEEPEELLGSGSGVLVNESDAGSSVGTGSGHIIGGGASKEKEEGSGSDIGIGAEPKEPGSGSDVNLVAAQGDDSDVAIVANDSELLLESSGEDLMEIDSAELQLEQNAIPHDSAQLELSIEPEEGSTGPVTDEELKEIADSNQDVLPADSGKASTSMENDISLADSSSGGGLLDSDDIVGSDDDSDGLQLVSSDIELRGSDSDAGGDLLSSGGASSLERMSDLDVPSESDSGVAQAGSRSADVLSELELLEQQGSGLITGDSGNLLASSGLGSGIGVDNIKDSELSDLDDALDGDDDLVIADDDDDLVISNAGSDISIAGDSGINLMSPSDSGLSLESEPLDLAGSSISALDLGAELSEGGGSGSSGSGGGEGSGSMVDFQADEEFQLSPSGVGLEADIDSGSQVIEVEDSEAIGEPVELGEDAFGEVGGDVFGAEQGQALALDDGGEAIAIDESATPLGAPAPVGAYEIPFTALQCLVLMSILLVMGVGGMLMTDLVRNMWTYSETSAPVSSLTDSLVSLVFE